MVKKAYYIDAKIIDSSEEGESLNRDSRSQLWKLMWQLKSLKVSLMPYFIVSMQKKLGVVGITVLWTCLWKRHHPQNC